MYQEATNSYAKNDTKQLYKVVKKLSGKANHPQPKKLNEFTDYLKNLLNNQPNVDCNNTPAAEEDLDIRLDDFSLDEVQKAVNALKFNKSLWVDYNITAETLRLGKEELLIDSDILPTLF